MSTPSSEPRLLILAAHPDDAEFSAGGLASLYRKLGRTVKMVSVTDGSAGHHQRNAEELIGMRRREAAAAGEVIGATYETLEFPDGELQPTLEVRRRMIKEIREFKPSLVLTHRTCDYHPDHRAVGQCVQDASYLVTVPGFLPDVPALSKAPVFSYMADLFTRPNRMRADIAIDVSEYLEQIVGMLACQESQVFEWLPYEEGTLDTVPEGDEARLEWLLHWYTRHAGPRAEHFRSDLQRIFGDERGSDMRFVEVFEISEYGTCPDREKCQELFPSMIMSPPNAQPDAEAPATTSVPAPAGLSANSGAAKSSNGVAHGHRSIAAN